MKIAIVYDSKTGNTKQLARAIREVCKEKVVYFGEPQEDIEADFYFIGSWTDKGNCSKRIQDFCEMLHNKKIAIFGTCGFGGSSTYMETLAKRFMEHFTTDNTIVGHFYCMGKMPMSIRERYVSMLQVHPEDKKLAVNIENFDDALLHPDINDINNVQIFVRELLEKQNNIA